MELMFTAVLCWIIFAIPVDLYTVAAILVVSAALAIYSINPVISKEVFDSIHPFLSIFVPDGMYVLAARTFFFREAWVSCHSGADTGLYNLYKV